MMEQSILSSQKNFHVMIKPNGPICNLACDYCYYLEKEFLYPKTRFKMQDEVLESFTRQYIRGQPVRNVVFSWQGGEPTLMGLKFFEQAIYYQQKYQSEFVTISNTIQTNGSLLDDEWCAFLKRNDFLVGISLDGPEDLHDRFRRDKSGKPSFKHVMAGIHLLQKHDVEYNILTSVHRGNVENPLEVYEFLVHAAGGKFIQFIPIVNRMNNNREYGKDDISIHSISGEEYGRFLITVFDLWVKRDVGSIFVQLFDEALGAWSGYEPGLCIFRKVCGDALVLEHNGDLYSCDHFVNPDHLLGNILNHSLTSLGFSNQQKLFGENKYETLPAMCHQCEYNFICHGGCPKNRFSHAPDGEEGLNVLCAGYKAFFGHVDEPMRIMADLLRHQEPPAKIMNLAW